MFQVAVVKVGGESEILSCSFLEKAKCSICNTRFGLFTYILSGLLELKGFAPVLLLFIKIQKEWLTLSLAVH